MNDWYVLEGHVPEIGYSLIAYIYIYIRYCYSEVKVFILEVLLWKISTITQVFYPKGEELENVVKISFLCIFSFSVLYLKKRDP